MCGISAASRSRVRIGPRRARRRTWDTLVVVMDTKCRSVGVPDDVLHHVGAGSACFMRRRTASSSIRPGGQPARRGASARGSVARCSAPNVAADGRGSVVGDRDKRRDEPANHGERRRDCCPSSACFNLSAGSVWRSIVAATIQNRATAPRFLRRIRKIAQRVPRLPRQNWHGTKVPQCHSPEARFLDSVGHFASRIIRLRSK